jgi:hypothetical protein
VKLILNGGSGKQCWMVPRTVSGYHIIYQGLMDLTYVPFLGFRHLASLILTIRLRVALKADVIEGYELYLAVGNV